MKNKIILYLGIVVAATGCTNSHSNDADKVKAFCLPDSMAKMISVDTVKSSTVMGELTLSGKITFNEEKVVKIYPLASGHVQELKVALGDYVTEGQLLALVRSADVAGILNDASAAKFDLAIAKKNMEATEDLYKNGISSEKDFITAQKTYEKAEATLNKSKEILKLYGGGESNLSGYYIKSPISGFIVEKKVNEGMEIRSDAGDNLFTISDLKDVWALANVYETDINKIKVGYDAKVTMISYAGRTFSGKVDKIFNVMNPDTKVLNVRIKLDNADYALKPGMFANIHISYSENKTMFSVSKDAVVFDENKYFVVIYNDKCNMQIKRISPYKTSGESVFFEDELKEGEKIIKRQALYAFYALKGM